MNPTRVGSSLATELGLWLELLSRRVSVRETRVPLRSASTPAHNLVPGCVLLWHIADEGRVVQSWSISIFLRTGDLRSRAISMDRVALVDASQHANHNDFMSAILLQQTGRAYQPG